MPRLKRLFSSLAIMLVALGFPLQVYADSPYPSLLPYALIGLLLILSAAGPRKRLAARASVNRIGLMVGIYLLVVLITTVIQAAFGAITTVEAANALAVYLPPAGFYFYFRRAASDRELRSVLVATVTAGLIAGLYFSYDSYLKLALHQVNDYALKAFEYGLGRSGSTADDANTARIAIESRSQGLLQSQSVSGTWVAFGAFAALALLPANRKGIRRLCVLAFGTMLLMGLNITSILAFAVIVFLFEFGGLPALRGHLRGLGRSLVPLVLTIAVAVGITAWVAGERMVVFMQEVIAFQTSYALGLADANISAIGLVIGSVTTYFQHLAESPFTLWTGDGFSSYGLMKGGDVGFIETLAKFGLPMTLAIVGGLFSLIASGLRRMRTTAGQPDKGARLPTPWGLLQFAISVTLMILISEIHYSVWSAKAVLPILFFALALFERPLVAPSLCSQVKPDGASVPLMMRGEMPSTTLES